MKRLFLFADEAGCFSFKRDPCVSRYFIVCTVLTQSCGIGTDLLQLRRDLAWRRLPVSDFFHATDDKQIVRDAVYELIRQHDFEVHATIMEKSKADLHTRTTEARFYQYAWYFHLKHSARRYLRQDSQLHITAATIGTKKKRIAFEDAVRDACRQTIRNKQWHTSFWPSQVDPCLQLADYCTWAIQRKWERGDTRSYDLIKDRVTYEYDVWERSNTHHY